MYRLFWISLLSVIVSCGERSDSSLLSERIVHQDQHLGEYLQVLPNGHVLSVSRDTSKSEGLGLVSIDPSTLEINVLDEKATEARDLQVSDGMIAYRLHQRIYYIQDGEKYQITDFEISKLRDAQFTDSYFHFIAEDLSEQTQHLCLDEDGYKVSQKVQKEKILHRLSSNSYIVQTKAGLELVQLSPCPQIEVEQRTLLLPGVEAKYVNTLKLLKSFAIGYLDERDGCLRVGTFSENGKQIRLDTVDGKPQESYVGLDLKLFSIGNEIGVLYLDGWKLQPKLARTKDSKWEVFNISSSSAGGFYPIILGIKDSKIKAAWHNFRTLSEGTAVSFEDLIFVELDARL